MGAHISGIATKKGFTIASQPFKRAVFEMLLKMSQPDGNTNRLPSISFGPHDFFCIKMQFLKFTPEISFNLRRSLGRLMAISKAVSAH